MAALLYDFGKPPKSGVYATRVPSDDDPELGRDYFLFWDSEAGAWFYLGSEKRYRGRVWCWSGPLPRLQRRHVEAVDRHRALQGSLDAQLSDVSYSDMDP